MPVSDNFSAVLNNSTLSDTHILLLQPDLVGDMILVLRFLILSLASGSSNTMEMLPLPGL